MNIERKLRTWQDAGLIDAPTVERLTAFERKTARPIFVYAISGLGALTVGIGLISLVAANWGEIPRAVKLAAAVLALAGLCFGVAWARARVRVDASAAWWRELFVILAYFMTLAAIALVGQSYQLGGNVGEALVLWTVVTTPLIFLAESGFTAVLWLVGVNTSLVFAAVALSDARPFASREIAWLDIAGLGTLPLLHLLLGSSPRFAAWKPAFANVMRAVAWVAIVIGASFMVHTWYTHLQIDDVDDARAALMPFAAYLIAGIVWAKTTQARAVLIVAATLSLAPLLAAHEPIDPAGAVSFIALWAVVGWAAYCEQELRLLNFATAVIAVRLVIIYVEVLGTLATTGFGLIAGGLLAIGLSYVWMRQSRSFKATLGKAS